MIHLLLNRTVHSWGLKTAHCLIAPYTGVGLGFARTTVYNFHTVQAAQATAGGFTTNKVGAIMSPNGKNGFAWDAHAGLNVVVCDSLSISAGYRFFDAGCFQSNNYLISTSTDFPTPIIVPAWKGKLRANELVIQAGVEW